MNAIARLAIAIGILGAALAFAGCASDMERSGVSNRPQNAPASWETQKGVIDVDK